MLPYAELVDAVACVPRVTLHGPWTRTVELALLDGPPPGSSGTRPEPLWAGGAVLHGARYTPAGSFPTLYLACDPVTALAEVGSVFSHPWLITTTIARNPVVVLSVDGVLSDVVDLTARSTRGFLGTTASELTGSWLMDSPAPTHDLGRAAYECGVVTALKFPSSKRPAVGWCLAVFTDRLTLNPANYVETIDVSRSLSQRLP